MDTRIKRYWLSLSLLSSIIVVDATNNDTSSELREPRVNGRIVKVYSGSRPEPFFCSKEGFQADPVNCVVFYRCVSERSGKYTVFRYQCAPGTVYDPDLETCNHPRNTRRSECGGVMKPDVINLSPEYNNEIEKDQKEVPRPISTVAPVYTEKTTRKNIVSSQFTNKYNTVPAFTTIYPWSSSTIGQTETTKYWSDKPTTNKLPTTSGDRKEICFSDGFIGDFDNCRKFYRCVGNQRGGFMSYEFYCSESTVWDDELQSCNHPWAVKRSKCGRSLSDKNFSRLELEQTTTQSSDYGYKSVQEQLQISHGSKVTQTQTQINHGDNVIQNQTQINYGDRVNYDKNSKTKQNQTQISHGSAVSQTQTQIDYGNKGMQTQLQIDHSKNSSQSQTQIHESTTKQTISTQHGSQQSTNDNQCSENGFMGDSNNCKKFYRCVDNGRGSFTKYEYQCGEGTVWDPTIESCNHAWAVKGCGGQISTESNKEQTTTTTSKSTIQASSTTQNDYTTTTTESDIEDIDAGYGNQGSSGDTTMSTSTTTSTTTEKSNSDSTVCKSSGFMGDSNDCKIFYRCVDNGKGFTKHEFKCGEGTVWDPDIEACNHAWAVKKCGGSTSSHKEETTTKQTTLGVQTTVTLVQTTTQPPALNEEYDSGYGQPAEKPSATSTTTTNPQEQNDDCTSTGFIGDSKNCKKFYRCVDNGNGGYTKHEFTCGEGTVWDPKIEACNHAWAVENCAGSDHQQGIQTSSSTKEPSSSYTTTDKNTDSPAITSTSSSTVHSTSESSSSSECSKNGFMGDKNNCKKFYRCVDNGDATYTRYEFTCGEGTVWDQKIEACNHAWAVEECGGNNYEISEQSTTTLSLTSQGENQELTGSTTVKTTSTTAKQDNEISSEECTKEGFFSNKNNCNKFYRCVDDGNGGFIKYDFTCGEGTVWNDNIQACDHAKPDGTCRSEVSTSSNETQHVNDEIENETTTKASASSVYPQTQSTQNPQSSENICQSEGFYGDSSDCKKFYRCVDDGKGGYTKYDFICGQGTMWNQEIQACDHESDDKTCLSSSTSAGSSSTSETPTDIKPTYTSPTTEKETDETPNQEYSDEKCSSEGFFPHSKDCKKFIRCVSDGNGKFTMYEFSCGEGTVWVQDIKACDHDDGSCKSQSSSSSTNQETTEASSTSSTTSEESQTPSKENDEYDSSNMSSDESDECSSEGYYGNNKDCRKFYRCVDNGNGGYTKYDFTCGEGTAWDSNIQTCNHIDQVETCSDSNKEDTQTQETPKDEEQTTENGSSTTKRPSESQGSSKDVCKEEGYYGDSQDCKKFYRCVDNGKGGYTKYDFVCGEGTIWDQDITNCNHPQDVSNPSCSSNQGESSTSSSSGSETTTSSSQSSSSTTEGTGTSSDCSSEKPAGNKNVTCDKAGYYPDPNDCKKFYRCVDWDGEGKRFSVYHFECGEGTIWDPALDTCNHEESVYPPRDCSSQSQSQSPSETTTEESTTTEQSTTQESTTTEQSTTSEQTTAQQTTTSEQTTTQQSTTSEQTTTQQSTTSEQTTTQQSTTSEQTTTQQTTSEQTTTQQSTTSEQTTTQQSTTSEQTTTQQSTTSEETTTQQSTTSEQTTTQESTTSEQTTQQSTTSEQTTQDSTTSAQTTQESTKETEGTTETTTGTTTEETSSTTESSQESTTEDSSSSDDKCPETDDNQYLLVCPTSFKRHPKYCNMFYQCEEEEDTHEVKIAMFKCPNETIYDESQTQCVEEKKADKKCEGEMARKQRFKRLSNKEPIVVDREKKSCPNVGYYAFEKQYECSPAFFKCEKLKSGKIRGLVNQCPKGYTFWSISKRCERVQNVKDCKTSSNDWTERWNIPTDRINIAL